MSRRLALAAFVLGRFGKPHLRATASPEAAARDFERVARLLPRPPGFCQIVLPLGGRPAHRLSAGPVRPGRAILHFHGGGFFAGSGATHAAMLARLSRLSRTEVIAPDYRLLQEAPFPAAVEDAAAAWAGLRRLGLAPSDILLSGDSAGGGLAFGLLASLLAQGERPAGILAFSPWTDMTLSGESLARLGPSDPLLPVERIAEVRDLWLAGADPRDPRASPLFAAFPAPPPVLIQVGAEEALLSDSERMAARLSEAGAEVTIARWPGCMHVWQLGDGLIPEARAALRAAAGFVQASFASVRR